jgi:DNA-directed RNA polymerase subunit M/transcription elongation factor TFIIS
MLYDIVPSEDGSIHLRCRKCPYTEPASSMLYQHTLRGDTATQIAVNPYLLQDPTLPRFKTIQCINDECPSRGHESDIVGVKVDPQNVVWMYQCAVCSTSWKQASRRG